MLFLIYLSFIKFKCSSVSLDYSVFVIPSNFPSKTKRIILYLVYSSHLCIQKLYLSLHLSIYFSRVFQCSSLSQEYSLRVPAINIPEISARERHIHSPFLPYTNSFSFTLDCSACKFPYNWIFI